MRTKIQNIQLIIVLVASILVGVISVTPSLLSVRQLGDNYNGIPFIFQDDEDIYLARINEIIDGHHSISSPVFFEYKNYPVLVPPVNEYVYAAGAIIGIPLSNIVVGSKFFFPAILFLLIYYFVVKLISEDDVDAKKIVTGLTAGVLVVLGYDLVDFRHLTELVTGSGSGVHLLVWTRLVNPIIPMLLFALSLIFTWRAYNKEEYKSAIIAGIVASLSLSYLFPFALLLTIVSLLILSSFILKNRSSVQTNPRPLLLILAIQLLSAVYFYWPLLISTGSPDGESSLLRSGLLKTHVPIWNTLVICAIFWFVISLLIARYKSIEFTVLKKKAIIFLAVMIVSSFFVYIQQIITGRTVWPYHFVQFTIPIVFIVTVISLYNISSISNKVYYFVLSVMIFFSIWNGVSSAASYSKVEDKFRNLQLTAPLFSYINNNAEKDCVVYPLEKIDYISRLIPAFTHCNVYDSTYTFIGVPLDRVRHNFLLKMYMLGIDTKDIKNYLENHTNDVKTHFFKDWTHLFSPGNDPETQKNIDQLTLDYKEFVKRDKLEQLHKFRVDYLVSRVPLPGKLLWELGNPKLVWESGEYYLYEISPK